MAQANASHGEWLLLRGLTGVALVLFLGGIVTPMFTLTKFVFIESAFSVLEGIRSLLLQGEYLLFLLLSVFTLLLPVLKLWLLYRATGRNRAGRQLRYVRLIHDLGRWSMLDVLVVAVLLVTVKLGAIASITIHYGLYLFGAAVLLMMLITWRVVHNLEQTA